MRAASQPISLRHDAHVVADGQMWHQPHLLDDVADAATQLDRVLGHDVLPAHEDLAACGLDQPVDHLEAGRLAAAGWADEDADLARRHFEAEIVDRQHVRVAPRDVAKLQIDGLHGWCTVYASNVETKPDATVEIGQGTRRETVGESAIIVPVNVPVGVNRLRERMDPSAADGVPAHITLIYPFMPPHELKDDVRRRIEEIIAAEQSFPFVLTSVRRWPTVVYLEPEPDDPFRRLTAALTAAFPDYPPYEGVHEEIIPHLTGGGRCARGLLRSGTARVAGVPAHSRCGARGVADRPHAGTAMAHVVATAPGRGAAGVPRRLTSRR